MKPALKGVAALHMTPRLCTPPQAGLCQGCAVSECWEGLCGTGVQVWGSQHLETPFPRTCSATWADIPPFGDSVCRYVKQGPDDTF